MRSFLVEKVSGGLLFEVVGICDNLRWSQSVTTFRTGSLNRLQEQPQSQSPQQAEWAEARLSGKRDRAAFTSTLKRAGVRTQNGYGNCTNAIYLPVLKANAKTLKKNAVIKHQERTGRIVKHPVVRASLSVDELDRLRVAEFACAGQLKAVNPNLQGKPGSAVREKHVEHVVGTTARYVEALRDGRFIEKPEEQAQPCNVLMESRSIPRLTKTQRFRSSYSLRLSNSYFELSKYKSLRRFQIFRRQLRAVLLERLGMQGCEFTLPLRPISKARPRSFQGQARPYMPASYKQWIKDARMHLGEWWTDPPLDHVDELAVHFYGPARGDLDNRVGSLLDAMNGLVITDDNVSVLPRMRLAFTKAKTAEARIYIRLTWRDE